MAAIRWEIFGPITVAIDEYEPPLSPRSRAVLLRLLFEPGRVVSADSLANFVWGDDLPRTYRNSVSRFVTDLRKSLGPARDRLVSRDGGYAILVEPGELDADNARIAIEDARRLKIDDVDGAIDAARFALLQIGHHENGWLLEFPGAARFLRERAELEVAALDTLAAVSLSAWRASTVVTLLEAAVADHPYNERLWQHLVEALRQTGRPADALRALQRLRQSLAEVGLEWSDASSRLEQKVLAGAAEGAVRSTDEVAGPIGRRAELAASLATIESGAHLAIVGMPGIGKSELVRSVVRDLRLGGTTVFEIDVDPVDRERLLLPLVAMAVGIPATERIADVDDLISHLRREPCVIVLDGIDRHAQAVHDLVAGVSSRLSTTQFVITGRSPLGIAREQVIRLGPLATCRVTDVRPSPAAEALSANTRAGLPSEDAETLAVLLAGHPGALRLAAGLIEGGADEAVTRLLVEPGVAATGAVRRVLDVVWSTLEAGPRSSLARLSVFRNGCTPDAARAVCGSAADDIDRLCALGLVARVDGRLFLDEAIRLYAADRLRDRRETDVDLDRLVEWLGGLNAGLGSTAIGCRAEASALLRPEVSNFTEALGHLRAHGRTEELSVLAHRALGVWLNHGHHEEIKHWFGPLVDDARVSTAAQSGAAAALVEADLTVGNYANIRLWGTLSLELADDRPLDWVPTVAGFMALWSLLDPLDRTTEELLDLAAAVAPATDSPVENAAIALLRRAQIAHHLLGHDEAVEHFRAGLELVQEPGRLRLALEMGETMSLYNGGRHEEALASVQQWRSKSDTDEWHYQVDIVRAVIVGGCGDPHAATVELANSLRRASPISVWARADEFQLAFGMLADLRGEHLLADQLLATPLSGSPFLTSVVAAHLARSRGFDGDGLEEIVRSMLARNNPHASRPNQASPNELVRWWESGSSH